MCGITGWVSYRADLTQQRAIVEQMTATMADRGPDAGGIWLRPRAALGHRRLAVIDPVGGVQPMSDGEVALTYSGEVYNYRELRAELVALGHQFRTNSDTEVVLRGYLAWGDQVAEKLVGMYAFALWDGQVDRLTLVRDRMGVKPLYLYPLPDGGVLFGSEPKAILANPAADRVVDTDCLRELVGFTKAAGWSLWKGMTEVEPGTVVTVDAGGLRQRTYWELPLLDHTDGESATVERIRSLLDGVVGQQLVSDVPLGVLLSGGLDSSAVTSLAAGNTTDGPLRTFSVDFIGQEERFVADEMRSTPDGPFIRDVVDWTGSKHQDVVLDPAALTDPELRRAVVRSRDMPIGLGDIDSSMYLLFKAIRAESTVALSGEFADELFGGYLWFHHPAARDANTFPWLAFQNSHTTDRTALLQPELRDALDIGGYIADQYADAVAAVPQLDTVTDPLERRMRVNCHLHLTRLVRALLDRKDRLSMAVGLEVRVPFADHRLVEYVYNTSWALKTFDGREKSLLRAAVAESLPKSVVERVKSPYPTPQDPAYGAALQVQAADVLAEPNSPVFDIVSPDWLRDAVRHEAATLPGATRLGLERVLDLYHWFDLYRPKLQLTS
ncbi:asparagine synthase (glutamine-hydrolyzing) [Kribbella sandramycini]|uniref:asparagine synthase (glutamine-hydrolyzing) n=1 Tax=Kribbella sandramycini TaxID=60450 RepID=A0A7Y4KYX9_9ACTN|nr:asparagine synthase (glutamine-hydrolyzing) [Kribbella sandramycini]MBB6569671.1 asparagine synthase (glutamine-hydrolyzing) [Kribbella sandramycini]NOL40497.1 asparagine synthase (glutamine-hydrolyzing) [Kribbella sandramycini]